MRTHLLQSALRAVVAGGSVAVPLEAMLAAAGVSRATFYKYFADVPSVVQAMAVELSDELIAVLDPLVLSHDDAAERVAIGMLGALRLVQALPALGVLLTQLGWPASELGQRHTFHTLVRADLERGMNQRRFVRMDLWLALDLTAGIAIAGAHRFTLEAHPTDLAPQVVGAALRALGVAADEARALARLPTKLPKFAPGSLLGLLAESHDAAP